MLSYQHGFHAGNFADVHKHQLLVALIEALNRKAKPWSYLETHAGRAEYDLRDAQAQKTGEFEQGVARVWQAAVLPAGLAAYVACVRGFNEAQALLRYPGSPALVAALARESDQLHLMELHPQEAARLKQVFRHDDRVAVHQRDGYEGVLALLPPRPNRGLVLIDPSYEVKTEYQQVVRFLLKAQQRWSNGCFAIWYPLLSAGRWQAMKDELVRTGVRNLLCSELRVRSEGEGMYGSGMLVVNPPWQLLETLQAEAPVMAQCLAQDDSAHCTVEMLVPE